MDIEFSKVGIVTEATSGRAEPKRVTTPSKTWKNLYCCIPI